MKPRACVIIVSLTIALGDMSLFDLSGHKKISIKTPTATPRTFLAGGCDGRSHPYNPRGRAVQTSC